MNRIDRLLGYLLVFQGRSLVRAQDLAARFEISERTVYRDIDALCEVGVPLVGMPGEGYRLMDGYHLPPIMFSEAEARALYLAIAMLTGLTTPGPTQTAAHAALDKIRAILPRATRSQVEALQAILGFHTVARSPLNLDDALFVRLQEAIHTRRLVHLRYHAQHSNDITERDVEPLQLVYVDNTWILHGYCRLRQAPRNFRLNRIDGLTVGEETFAPRAVAPHRSAEDVQHVLVRFDADVARWVRERQHFTFVEEQVEPDDTVLMRYAVASLGQIKGWLLSWGAQMEVLEPAELREEIAQTAAALWERHRHTARVRAA